MDAVGVGERVLAPSGPGVVTRVSGGPVYPFAYVLADAGAPHIHYVRDLEPEFPVDVTTAPAGAVR